MRMLMIVCLSYLVSFIVKIAILGITGVVVYLSLNWISSMMGFEHWTAQVPLTIFVAVVVLLSMIGGGSGERI